MPLYDILNEFQKGHSHIAVVYRDLNAKKEELKEDKHGRTSKHKKHRGNGETWIDENYEVLLIY